MGDHHEPPSELELVFIWLMVLLMVVLIGFTVATQEANAHEIGRKECRQYQQMRLFVTGSKRASMISGRKCRIKARAHNLTHPLPDSLLPYTLRMIRACESGKRDKHGRGIDGTYYYKAQNKHSTASGAYQYLDSTWGNHLGYAKARYAPARVQDRRALRDYREGGTSPWNTSKACWG